MRKRTLPRNEYGAIIVFAVIFLFLLSQFSHVLIYFDDYGYYSLTYGILTTRTGHDYNLFELLNFLRLHWLGANGRLLYYFFWLTSYMLAGLKGVQFLAALTVTAVLVFMWRLLISISKACEQYALLTAVNICLCYGLLQINILQSGVYWYAATFHYVGSLVPFLVAAILVAREQKKRDAKFNWAIAVCFFMAAWGQESWSVATLFFAGYLLLLNFIQSKKVGIWYIIYVFCSAFGLMILVTSPGLSERSSLHEDFNNLSFFEKIFSAIPDIFKSYGSLTLFQIALNAILILLGICLFQNDRGMIERALNICSIFIALLTIGCFVIQKVKGESGYSLAMMVLLIVGAVLMTVQLTRYYIRTRDFLLLGVYYATIVSIGCLCMVPDRPLRLFIPFVMLSSLFFVKVATHFTQLIGKGWTVLAVLCVSLFALTAPNVIDIYLGYKENVQTLVENDINMRAAAEQIAQGNTVQYVTLHKLPDDAYAGQQLYCNCADFMKYWICQYYAIPYETELRYIAQDGKVEVK